MVSDKLKDREVSIEFRHDDPGHKGEAGESGHVIRQLQFRMVEGAS